MEEFIEELKNNQKTNKKSGLENIVDLDYVIERLEEINKKEQKGAFLCPLCNGDNVIYKEFNGTYFYICEDCPFVSLEFVEDKDAKNLVEYLTKKKEKDKTKKWGEE